MREGRESGVSPSGDRICYIFTMGNHARNGVGIVVRFKNLFTLGTCFQVFYTMVLVSRVTGKRAGKSMREEATKFEKFKQRKPEEEEEKNLMKNTIKS